MIDRLAVIQAEAEQFAAVLAETPGQTRVPTCTDWDASDLLWHLTEVHLFWAGVLRSGALTDDDVAVLEAAIPARPETLDDAFALRRQATEDLIDALEELDDAQPRWSWWEPEQTVGFTRRMQTYEATMHRVDAERAAGLEPGPRETLRRLLQCRTSWPPAPNSHQLLRELQLIAVALAHRQVWSAD